MKNRSEVRLGNGLAAIITPAEHLHKVNFAVGVRYGSVYEDLRINGSAHFLEHVLFEGTRKRTGQQQEEEARRNALERNAFTAEEATVYFIAGPRSTAEKSAEMLSDMLINSTLEPAAVESQRGPITNELTMRHDNKFVYLYDMLKPVLFEGQPAGRLVAGTPEIISRITRDELFDIYQNNYAPASMALSIYGGISGDKARAIAETYFGGFKKPYTKKEIPDSEGPSKEKEVAFERSGIAQANRLIAFGFPGTRRMLSENERDLVSLILIDQLFKNELEKDLKKKEGLAGVIKISTDIQGTSGSFGVGIAASQEKMEKISRFIYNELEKVRCAGVPKDAIERAKSAYWHDMQTDLDNAVGMGIAAAFDQATHSRQLSDLKEGVLSYTADDIARAAQKYLDRKRSAALTLWPKGGGT